MAEKRKYTIELTPTMHEFLDQIAKQYHLSDSGKALRCLVNFTRERSDLHDEIFSEVRCLDC